MEKIKLGLQVHAVRESFTENYRETFRRIAEMGYDGMELNYWRLQDPFEAYAEEMKKNGLHCLGCMLLPQQLSQEELAKVIRACKILGTDSTVICQLDVHRIKGDPSYPAEAVRDMLWVMETLRAEGIRTGYHSHDVDSTRLADGCSFYEYVMDHTPKEFSMVIDTGNTMGGGDDPIALLKKYPGRTPVLHLKGYGQEKDYATPVWESELDMEKLMTIALDECGAETVIIEFGKRGDYEPFQRAEESLIWLKALLKKMGRI